MRKASRLYEALAAGGARIVDIRVMALYYEFIVTFGKDVLPPSIG